MQMQRCSTCKHFVMGVIGKHSECHLNPPTTTTFVIGIGPNGQPALHKEVSFGITLPEWSCGQWAMKLHQAVGEVEFLPPVAGRQ
jgi:hypothetical protein